MQTTKVQHFHKRLMNELESLVNQRKHFLDTIQERIHPPGDTEAVAGEAIDVEIALDQRAATRHQQISAALVLIKQGRFGMCSQCGQEISEDRLQEIPCALRCVRCEESRDRRFSSI